MFSLREKRVEKPCTKDRKLLLHTAFPHSFTPYPHSAGERKWLTESFLNNYNFFNISFQEQLSFLTHFWSATVQRLVSTSPVTHSPTIIFNKEEDIIAPR